jgi:membrane protein YqaA with SNARE-associated domain
MNPSETLAPEAEAAVPTGRGGRERMRKWLRPILLSSFAVAANIVLYLLPINYRIFGQYAYLGVFLITLIANATTIVPVPYIPIVACIAGQSNNLALVIVAGALGSALGESVAFFIGRSGRGIIAETRFYGWVQHQMRHPWRAFAILFGLAAPPNPAFDVAGLAAGALGLPYWLFFSAVLLGRMIRMGLIALVGIQLCYSSGL